MKVGVRKSVGLAKFGTPSSFLSFVLFLLLLLAGLQANAVSRRIRVEVLSRYNWTQCNLRSPSARVQWLKGKASFVSNLNEDQTLSLSTLSDGVRGSGLGSEKEGMQVSIQGTSNNWIEVEGEDGVRRKFRGNLQIRKGSRGLIFFLDLTLEDYVQGVLASEMPADAPTEALKAMAVVIRSFAVGTASPHASEGFDFCDLTHCQAFAGWREDLPQMTVAVHATHGLTLTFHGRPIQALYHSTCGGHTSPNQKVFGGTALPYLQGVVDEPYCRGSPHYSWDSTISKTELEEVFRQGSEDAWGGPLLSIVPAVAEPNGRVFSVEAIGQTRTTLRTEKFLSLLGKKIGWNRLKSNWFTIAQEGEGFRFTGHGLGHGVGLCQWGARGMASAGKKFDEILRFYFPGTKLLHQ